jgi:hypothetical protein
MERVILDVVDEELGPGKQMMKNWVPGNKSFTPYWVTKKPGTLFSLHRKICLRITFHSLKAWSTVLFLFPDISKLNFKKPSGQEPRWLFFIEMVSTNFGFQETHLI